MNNTIQKQIESAWQTLGNLGWLWVALVLALVACSPAAAPVSSNAPANPAPAAPVPAPVTGTLQVSISGLPAGVAASVEVKGPENFSQTLTQSTALSKLKSGTYSFTLNAVKPDSATFSGSSTSLNFEASLGGSVSLNYSCSSVKAPDASLDFLLRAFTSKANSNADYTCADLARLRSLESSPSQPGAITNLEGLQYATGLTSLSLVGNRISTFPTGMFDQMPNLTRLDLDDNRISSLPAGIFDRLTSLTTLTLRNNQVSTLPAGIFDKLTNLTRLSLRNNQFGNLPTGMFDKLTNLTDLDLIGNRISNLPTGIFDKLTNLTTLLLAANLITTLPAGIFGKLPNGATVNLVNTCLVINQNPVKASLVGLTRLNVQTFPALNQSCPQKTINFSSLQARLLTDNRNAPEESERVFFRITIDGVDQGDFDIRDRLLRPQETATINTNLIVNTELKIEVFTRTNPIKSIGEAVLPIDADYAPGINRFSLLGSGSVYVLTLNQQ